MQETYHDWQRMQIFDWNKIAEHILGYGVVAVVFTPRHACGSTPGFDLINIRIYEKEDDRNLSISIQRNTAEAHIQIYGEKIIFVLQINI